MARSKQPTTILLLLALVIMTIIATASAIGNIFDTCNFGYGVNYDSELLTTMSPRPTAFTHFTFWAQDWNTTDQWDSSSGQWLWATRWIKLCKELNKTPVLYGYIIAAYGKKEGLTDCDMGDNNLCRKGADIIRDTTKWGEIINKYKYWATQMAKFWPTDRRIVVLIEPDFFQYSETGSNLSVHGKQNNGGIPDADLVLKYKEIRAAIKSIYPYAWTSIDASPWLNDNLKTWFERFGAGDYELVSIAGGRTNPTTTTIRDDANNNVTWENLSQWTNGKPVLADAGYGVGGAPNDYHIDTWFQTANVQRLHDWGLRGVSFRRNGDSLQWFHDSQTAPYRSEMCVIGGTSGGGDEIKVEAQVLKFRATLKVDVTMDQAVTALKAVSGPDEIAVIESTATAEGVSAIADKCIKADSIVKKLTVTANSASAALKSILHTSEVSTTKISFSGTIFNTPDCINMDNWTTDPVLSELMEFDPDSLSLEPAENGTIGLFIGSILVILALVLMV